nr:FlgB family protein [Pseudaestuariivita rosea]
MAHAMAQHASARQNIVAQNIANADTPGYRARDITPFAEQFAATAPMAQQKATRAGHLHGDSPLPGHRTVLAEDQSNLSPNGNSVSIEHEMFRSIETKRQHDRAIMIYKSGLNVLHSTIGRQ